MAATDLLEDPVGRNVNQDVEDVEDGESDVELIAGQIEVFGETINLRIT